MSNLHVVKSDMVVMFTDPAKADKIAQYLASKGFEIENLNAGVAASAAQLAGKSQNKDNYLA